MANPQFWREYETDLKAAGYTQKQAAQMIGVSPRYLRKLKTGERSGNVILNRPHRAAGLFAASKQVSRERAVSGYVRIPESTVGKFVSRLSKALAIETKAIAAYCQAAILNKVKSSQQYKRIRVQLTPRERTASRVKVRRL